jgi:hypothetical protein
VEVFSVQVALGDVLNPRSRSALHVLGSVVVAKKISHACVKMKYAKQVSVRALSCVRPPHSPLIRTDVKVGNGKMFTVRHFKQGASEKHVDTRLNTRKTAPIRCIACGSLPVAQHNVKQSGELKCLLTSHTAWTEHNPLMKVSRQTWG